MKCPKHTIEEIGVGCEVIKENHEKISIHTPREGSDCVI
jgi:hypothetical protein